MWTCVGNAALYEPKASFLLQEESYFGPVCSDVWKQVNKGILRKLHRSCYLSMSIRVIGIIRLLCRCTLLNICLSSGKPFVSLIPL